MASSRVISTPEQGVMRSTPEQGVMRSTPEQGVMSTVPRLVVILTTSHEPPSSQGLEGLGYKARMPQPPTKYVK